jgi:hypothetical protein
MATPRTGRIFTSISAATARIARRAFANKVISPHDPVFKPCATRRKAMKAKQILLMTLFASLITGAAYAETPPKRSGNFLGNYQTLVKNQHASPRIASCIATGYDLVRKNKTFDRLGFTEEDIGKARTNRKASKFSADDPTQVSSVIEIQGQARPRANTTKWRDITLRCGIVRGKIRAIEIRSAGN